MQNCSCIYLYYTLVSIRLSFKFITKFGYHCISNAALAPACCFNSRLMRETENQNGPRETRSRIKSERARVRRPDSPLLSHASSSWLQRRKKCLDNSKLATDIGIGFFILIGSERNTKNKERVKFIVSSLKKIWILMYNIFIWNWRPCMI